MTEPTKQTTPAASAKPTAPAVRLRPTEVLALAVWFGVMTGLGELAVVGYKIAFQDLLPNGSVDILWMTLVLYAVLYGAAGAVLAALAAVRPWFGSVRVVGFVFLTATLACLLYHLPVNIFAVLALSLGLGFRGSVVLGRRPRLLTWVLDKTTGWAGWATRLRRRPAIGSGEGLVDRRQVLVGSATTVAGLAAGVTGWEWWQERRARAALPLPPAGRPNVIFVVLDTVRAESLSLYGYGRPTSPALERWARQGVTFTQALAPSSWTLPSHAAMFTGRPLDDTKVDVNVPYRGSYPTLAEVLRGEGYETAGFVANPYFLNPAYGLSRGFIHYRCTGHAPGQFVLTSRLCAKLTDHQRFRQTVGFHELLGRQSAADLNRDLFDWMDEREPGRPFFAFMNYFDAHSPYVPPAETKGSFGPRVPADPSPWLHRGHSADDVDLLRTAYDRCVLGIDNEVGRLLDGLSSRGRLDDTVVVITSDHGEHFGEHGFLNHGHDLYLSLLRVPLVVLHPTRAARGEVIERPVSLRDLPATILDLAGGPGGAIPGQSLAVRWQADRAARAAADRPVLSDTTRAPEHIPGQYPATKGPMKCWVWDGFHYIRNGDGSEELYHLADDPGEQQNLVKSPAAAGSLDRLRRAAG